MIFTERQAFEMLCPLRGNSGQKCLGASCMLWRDSRPTWEEIKPFLKPSEMWPVGQQQITETLVLLAERDRQFRDDGWEPQGGNVLFGYPSHYGRGKIRMGYCGAGGKP